MAGGVIRWFQLGARGVDVVNKPQDLDESELIKGQNAEIITTAGEGALGQRPGMSKINTSSMDGSVVMVRDILANFLSDYTQYLYAGYYTGATHHWRRSVDGSVWENVDTPVKPWSNNTNIGGYFKRYPKCVNVGNKMYFLDGNTTIGIHAFDGSNDLTASTVPPSVFGTTLSTPDAPTITSSGPSYPIATPSAPTVSFSGTLDPGLATPTLSAVHYVDVGTAAGGLRTLGYKLVAKAGTSHSAASTEYSLSIAHGLRAATDSTPRQYIAFEDSSTAGSSSTHDISTSGSPVTGATSYDVYLTQDSGGRTLGKIGSIGISGTLFTNGNGAFSPSGSGGGAWPFVDDGTLTGDGVSPPGSASANTSYSYKVVAIYGSNHSAVSAAASVTGAAALDSSNYNTITPPTVAGVASFDIYRTVGGSTQGKIGSCLAGASFNDTSLTGDGTSAPGSASPSSGTTYSYQVVAIGPSLHSAVSSTGSFSGGLSTLTSSDYTIITPTSPPVTGATSYDVYRTVGGTSQGKIGSIPIAAGAFTTGNGSSLGSGNVFTDASLAGDGATAPSSATGASTANAKAILETVTDGTNIYVCVLDANSGDPTINGRVIYFAPVGEAWTQLGSNFPVTANGNGTPSALVLYDGAWSYGTYIGTTSGNTSYLTGFGTPLPAGGIQEVHTTSPSFSSSNALAVFNGNLYAATASLSSGVAATVLKRAALATWTVTRTGPGTAALNAYTTLYVFNNTLFAGWTSGDGTSPARIESTTDGVTWTNEITLNSTEVPCQMITFKGNLYAVLGKTGASYNTATRIIKRTPGGSWSTVDSPSDALAGCIGIAYV